MQTRKLKLVGLDFMYRIENREAAERIFSLINGISPPSLSIIDKDYEIMACSSILPGFVGKTKGYIHLTVEGVIKQLDSFVSPVGLVHVGKYYTSDRVLFCEAIPVKLRDKPIVPSNIDEPYRSAYQEISDALYEDKIYIHWTNGCPMSEDVDMSRYFMYPFSLNIKDLKK